MKVTSTPTALRFARYMHPAGDACWMWYGAKNQHGYGVIGRGGRGRGTAKAHRVSYEMFHGVTLTPGQVLMHRCDNPARINPWHLTIGTHADNAADMRAKGRDVAPPVFRGMRNRASKLNDSSVIEIFEMRARGQPVSAIARHFDVDRHTVTNVLNRKNWNHINVANHLS